MNEVKINFVDFWTGFDKSNNYFFNLLSKKYIMVIDENPELLFYSCFGKEHLKYDCTRIFYTGENIKPDYMVCDFAFSFQYSYKKNHFRLPLYSLYIDHHSMLDSLKTIENREKAIEIWKKKSKFCCMVVSNPNCPERIAFFHNLTKVKQVDSGGSVLNNVGGKVANKMDFIKDYKFVISFENTANDGYTTEKILEPISTNCIPIYWGNKLVDRDFNKNRFIDYNKFETEKELIDKLLEIDQNDAIAIEMLMQPTFNENKISHEDEHQQVLIILTKFIENPKIPIAQQFWSKIYIIKLRLLKIKKSLLNKVSFI
jgi:hypothetical protein